MIDDPGTPLPGPHSLPPHASRWRPVARAIAGLALLAALALAGWGYWVETWPPVVRRATIALDSPALAARPVRLALASDIHVGNHGMTPARLERVVDQIMAERPDVIVLAGDFVNGDTPGDAAARPDLLTAPLSRLHAPLGVVAVIGNHDGDTDPEAVVAVLEQAGITVLRNAAVRMGPLTFAGFDAYRRQPHPRKAVMPAARQLGGPIIALEHGPGLARHLPPDVPLMLAGHTHCGQINLPGLSTSRSFVDGRMLYDPAFRCGLIRRNDHSVVVTGGVGSGSFPLRIGTRTDFWMLTLTGR